MDDISRELPPDETGATPVSERQKGPEELQRFELGNIGDDTDDTPRFGNRLAGMGAPFLAERFLSVSTPMDSASPMDGASPTDSAPDDANPSNDSSMGDGGRDEEAVPSGELPAGEVPEVEGSSDEPSEESVEGQAAPEASVSEEVDSDDGEAEEPEPEQTAVEAVVEESDADQAVEGELADDEPAADDVVTDKSDDDVEAPDFEEESAVEEAPETEEAVEVETGDVDNSDAQAAVAAEASTMELDNVDDLVDSELGEDGLPIVPDLTEAADVARMVYVMMMTSREGMTVIRLARACNTTQKLVEEGLELLQQQLRGLGLPVELTRVGDTVRWMSGASAFPYLQRLRGVKKLEKLSPAALETLAVIAYRQPVMRSEIEAIRGVKAGPMLRTLLQHKLACVAGRADVPGRPLQYGTTQQFLERFGLASLAELPSVKEWKNLG